MLGSLLKTVAPFLGGIIGGPVGAIATKALSSVLTPGNDNPSEAEIEIALEKATPAQILEIKKIDAEYKVSLAQIEFDDRKDARDKAITTKDNTPRNLAYTITLCYFIFMFMFFFDSIHISNAKFFEILLVSLNTSWVGIMAFYFGGMAKKG